MAVSTPPQSGAGSAARSAVLVAVATLALATFLWVVWLASTSLLIIFAGILVAVALDAGAELLSRVIGGPRPLRLGIVVFGIAALLVAAMAWGGTTLVEQFGQFASLFNEQVNRLVAALKGVGISFGTGQGQFDYQSVLPNMGALAGGATSAIFSFFGVAGSVIIVLFLGVFFASEPTTYKLGILNIIPRDRRDRVSDVMDRSARALRGWMFAQSISVLAVFVLALFLLWLIGMPYALVLALLSGLLEFIPTLGPALAGVIIVLGGLAQGLDMALWAFGAYLVMQSVESNLLQPLVQERLVRLPAAFNLSFQLIMGALFGFLGIALAVPIAAAAKVFLDELYVEDVLGGKFRKVKKDSPPKPAT